MTAPASLPQIVDTAPLLVCLGPGGVGKTTTSAILALRKAVAGQAALVLTIDPARRLADALGLSGLANDPADVQAFAAMHPKGSLAALMLDPRATFDHLISLLVPDPQQLEQLLANRFYQHLSQGLAGTLEYMATERLHDLVQSHKYQGIVLDTPPTSNALDFLDAPQRAARFFHRKVTRWFIPSSGGKGWTARLFDSAGSRVLGLLSMVAGESFVDDMSQFFAAFSGLFEAFQARGEHVGALLRDPHTAFIIVCSAEASRVNEAVQLAQKLREQDIHPAAFIVNSVVSVASGSGIDPQQHSAEVASLLGEEHNQVQVQEFLGRLEKNRGQRQKLAELHAAAVENLRQQVAPCPVFTAPRVPMTGSARENLLAIYSGLFYAD